MALRQKIQVVFAKWKRARVVHIPHDGIALLDLLTFRATSDNNRLAHRTGFKRGGVVNQDAANAFELLWLHFRHHQQHLVADGFVILVFVWVG